MPREPMTPSFPEQQSSISSPRELPREPSVRRFRAGAAGFLATCGAAAAFLLAPGTARAQDAVSSVSVDAKGVVGGALLGAEVVDLTIGIIGVDRAWPYIVFGAAGAVGGGIGGYFVEQETRDTPEAALYMLAGGMALVIPTVIVSLNATMYKPPEGTSTTTIEPADNQPAQSPSQIQAPMPTQLPPPAQTRLRLRSPSELREHVSFSLIDVHEGSLALSVPALQIRPLYSPREMWTYGVQQGTEVRLPLFQASF